MNLGPGRPRAPTRKTAPGWVLSYECALSELLELPSRKKGGALGICETPTTQSSQSITLSGIYTLLDSRSHILISPLLRKWPLSYSFFTEAQCHFLPSPSG